MHKKYVLLCISISMNNYAFVVEGCRIARIINEICLICRPCFLRPCFFDCPDPIHYLKACFPGSQLKAARTQNWINK